MRSNMTREAKDQFEVVRKNGTSNMLDYPGVLSTAIDFGCSALVAWMKDVTPREYGVQVMEGTMTAKGESTSE